MNQTTKKVSVRESRQELQEKISKVNELLDLLQTHNDSIESIVKNVQDAENTVQEAKTCIEDFKKELFEGNDEDVSIKEDIELSQQRADEVYTQTQKFKRELFGFNKTENIPITETEASGLKPEEILRENEEIFQKTKKFVPGIQQKISECHTNISETKEKHEKEHENLIIRHQTNFSNSIVEYNNQFHVIKKQIESFMPEGMSVGLSAAYFSAKKEHQKNEDFWKITGGLALLGILTLTLIMFIWILPPSNEISDLFKNVIRTAFFDAPFIWLAIIANKRLKDAARLREEYLHKWAIAYSYTGLKKEAEILDEVDEQRALSKDLLSKVIAAYAQNPSHLTDTSKSDIPIVELVEKIIAKKML